jgi:hypothetical protein
MKDFTLHPEALELKQLGFDEPCFAYYKDGRITGVNKWDREEWGFHVITNKDITSVTSEIVIAPTYSQAFRWFRDKHQLIHHMYWVYKKKYDGIDWIFHIKGINMINNNVVPHDETRFETYEEAELACLKKLIEIANEQQ